MTASGMKGALLSRQPLAQGAGRGPLGMPDDWKNAMRGRLKVARLDENAAAGVEHPALD